MFKEQPKTISLQKPSPNSTYKLTIAGELPISLAKFLLGVTGVKHIQGLWYIPKEPRMLELLLRDVPEPVYLTEDVCTWYNKILFEETEKVNITKFLDVVIPGVDPRLTAYQRVGVNFILHNKRCILADGVGLGKTAQALEAIEASHEHRWVLIICTNSAKYWLKEEIEKWFPGQPRFVLDASTRAKTLKEYSKSGGFLILNWELVRLVPELRQYAWDWVVADEAHRLKNRGTKVWKAVQAINTQRLLLVTGTPLANMPADLWALLNLLYPEKFPSYWRFHEMYVNYFLDWFGYKRIVRDAPVRNIELLQREIAPFFLQRNRVDFRDTLPPQFKTIPLPLTKVQRTIYKSLAKAMYAEYAGTEVEVFDAGAKLIRLRQVLSTTATLYTEDHSSKLDAAIEIIKDAPEDQFVVFAVFRETVFALKRRLEAQGISCDTIIGMQEPKERTEVVSRFQAGELRVIIATVQAGGESLTLTAAHQIIFIEKHYSANIQEQAIGRIDRFGQTEQCFITYLTCPHTVDDLVDSIVAYKEKMISQVLHEQFFENLQDSIAFL